MHEKRKEKSVRGAKQWAITQKKNSFFKTILGEEDLEKSGSKGKSLRIWRHDKGEGVEIRYSSAGAERGRIQKRRISNTNEEKQRKNREKEEGPKMSVPLLKGTRGKGGGRLGVGEIQWPKGVKEIPDFRETCFRSQKDRREEETGRGEEGEKGVG